MRPQTLHRLVFDFRVARAILAGVELGLFEALDPEGSDVEEIAERTGCAPRAIEVWSRAMATCGVLEEKGPGWRLHPELRCCLLPDGDDYVGNLLLHDAWHWTRWAALEETLRSGRANEKLEGDHHLSRPEVLERFLPNYNHAMRQSARGAARVLAGIVAEKAPQRVVDFGGGSGDLLAAVCEELPDAQCVLVEHEFALAGARENLAGSGADQNIKLLALDFEKADPPSPYGAAILSRVIMGMPPDRAERALQRVAAGLEPGGYLYLHDFDAACRVGAVLGLDMLLNTGGQIYTDAQLRSWMGRAGLVEIEDRPVLPYTRVWIGRRGT